MKVLYVRLISYGKHFYKHLQMGVIKSPYMFHQKMNDLLQGFEFISAFIYNIFILNQFYWSDSVQTLESTLNQLKESGIKCNTKRIYLDKPK